MIEMRIISGRTPLFNYVDNFILNINFTLLKQFKVDFKINM